MCDPAASSGLCRNCRGTGGVTLFEIPAGEWPSAEGSMAPEGNWPCSGCNASGACSTCRGAGTLDDHAWEDVLLQPYLAD